MGVLFLFIFISILIFSALLFFNKGEKAQEIKSILKDIFENFRELFSNLKKLFLILKDLIQTKLDNDPIQLNEESSSDDSSTSDDLKETNSKSSTEIELPSQKSTPDAETKTEVIADQGISSPSEVTPSSQEINPDPVTSESIPELIVDQEIPSPSEVTPSSQEINPNMSNSIPMKATEPELISSEVDSPEDYSNHDEEIDKNN